MNGRIYQAVKTLLPDLDNYPRDLDYWRVAVTRQAVLLCEVCSVSAVNGRITLVLTHYSRAHPPITRVRKAVFHLDLDNGVARTLWFEDDNMFGCRRRPRCVSDEEFIEWIKTLRRKGLVLSLAGAYVASADAPRAQACVAGMHSATGSEFSRKH